MQPDLIRPGLYLSSLDVEVYKDVLDAHAITHILQVGAELGPTHISCYQYLQLPVRDVPEQDIIKCFPKAFAFIDSALDSGGAVLVHCQAGVSRSATVVIGYCMWKDKMSAEAATKEVMRARSVIWPNPGFKCQLREFESLSCDVSKWNGWSSSKYLSMQYGEENLGFVSNMLGGAPVDHLLGTGCRADPTRVLHRARSAYLAEASSQVNGMSELYGLAGKSRRSSSSHDDACETSVASSRRSFSYERRPDDCSQSSRRCCCQGLESSNDYQEQAVQHRSGSSSSNGVGSCSKISPGCVALAAAVPTRITDATISACESVALMDKEAALLMAG